MGEFSISHVLILTVILLIFFGPSRLPGLGQSIGKAIRGFKEGLNETESEINKSTHHSPPQPSQQIPPQNQNPISPATTDEKNRQNNS